MQTLTQYLAEKNITQGQFADMMGVTQSAVSKWVSGHPPKRTLMQKIEQATNGKVPVRVWFEENAA